jgi:hypothetical protein
MIWQSRILSDLVQQSSNNLLDRLKKLTSYLDFVLIKLAVKDYLISWGHLQLMIRRKTFLFLRPKVVSTENSGMDGILSSILRLSSPKFKLKTNPLA